MVNLVSTLTARLVDDISRPAKGAAASLKQLSAAEKALVQLEAQKGKLATLKQQQASFAKSRQAFEQQRKLVIQLAQDQAKAGTATKAMTAKITAARNELKALAKAMDDQKNSAIGIKRGLEGVIGPITTLASAEAKLASNIDRARHALDSQAAAEAHAAKQRDIRQKRQDAIRHGLGDAAVAAGLGIGGATVDAVKEGARYQRSVVGMRSAGIPEKDIADAQAQADHLQAQYTNVKRSEILDTYKELRSVLQHPDETKDMLPATIRAKSALNAIDPSGEGAHSLGFAIKGAEVLGLAQDPKRFENFLDSFVKAKQVMGELITPESIYELAKYSKSSGAHLSDRFKMTTGLSLSQEMGGSTTGKSVDQFVKLLTSGFRGPTSKPALSSFLDLGLVTKDQVEMSKQGKPVGLKHGQQVAGADLAMTDPDKWVYQYLLPALTKKGITDPLAITAAVRQLFPNSNSADLVSKIITQQGSFENHAKLYSDAKGLDATNLNQTDPTVALGSLTTALQNFGSTLTSPIMSKAAGVMSSLASTIGSWSESLSGFQKAHPDLAQWLAGGATAGGLAAGSAGVVGLVKGLMGGFGLSASATALDGSAAALNEAAVALGAKGAVTGASAAGGASLLGTFIKGASWPAMMEFLANFTTPGDDKRVADGAAASQSIRARYGDATLSAARSKYQPWYMRGRSLDSEDSSDVGFVHRYLDDQRQRRRGWMSPGVTEAPTTPYGSFTRDPSAHGAVLDGPVQAATQAGQQMKQALDITAKPTVDTGSIDAAIGKANQLKTIIQQVQAMDFTKIGGASAPKAVPAPMTNPMYGHGN